MQLSLRQARDKGHEDLYLTYNGIGDTLALLFAARGFHEEFKRKMLVGTDLPELFDNCGHADVLTEFSYLNIRDAGILGYKLHELEINGINPIFVAAGEFVRRFNDPGTAAVRWPATHIMARCCERVGLSGNIAIDPRLDLTEEEKGFGVFFDKNQVSIMSDGGLKYKTWPVRKMQKLVNLLKHKYSFVQIGHKDDAPLKHALDRRGRHTLRQVASILHNSRLFVGNIGGLMHMARAVGCRSVIAYSSAEPPYLVDYPCNINISPLNGCDICGLNVRSPYYDNCRNNYTCVRNIEIEDMIRGVENLAERRNDALEIARTSLVPDKAHGVRDLRESNLTGINYDAINFRASGAPKRHCYTIKAAGLLKIAKHRLKT